MEWRAGGSVQMELRLYYPNANCAERKSCAYYYITPSCVRHAEFPPREPTRTNTVDVDIDRLSTLQY